MKAVDKFEYRRAINFQRMQLVYDKQSQDQLPIRLEQ